MSVEMKRLPEGASQAMSSLIEGLSLLQENAPEDAGMIRRRDAMKQFQVNGFPDRRIEAWRYTDLIGALEGPLPPLVYQREMQQC